MHRNIFAAAAMSGFVWLGACAASSAAPQVSASEAAAPETEMMMEAFTPETLTATIINETGGEAGTLTATSAPLGVVLRFEIAPGTLSPGWHGLHLHQVPDCSDIGVFKLSGGHVGMTKGGHGLLNPMGPETGDLPNIHAAEDGSANAEMFTTFVKLDELMAAGGFAMIIHANPDDHVTQPIGGAGPRKACAAVKP